VTAVNSQGRFAEYANFGSCVAAAVPSGETIWNGGVNLVTCDVTGSAGYNPNKGDTFPDLDYTSVFTGSSSTAPLMCGILALAKEAQPNLTTRMAKHLLARTCRMVDPADGTSMGGWVTNAAGFHFNNNYGFGLVDADALTYAATRYSGVTPLVTNTSGQVSAGSARIPVGDTNGVTVTCTVTNSGSLEEVQVRLRINTDHGYVYSAYYGQINATIRSPSGTSSKLVSANPRSINNYVPNTVQRLSLDWTFTDNAFWGEIPSGQWAITLSHPYPAQDWSDTDYLWDSVEIITRSGQLIPAALAFQTQIISNQFVCSLSGPVGDVVAVESSSDLITWAVLSTNTLAPTPLIISDANVAASPSRFFRARLIQPAQPPVPPAPIPPPPAVPASAAPFVPKPDSLFSPFRTQEVPEEAPPDAQHG
jgi:hypothetical protein